MQHTTIPATFHPRFAAQVDPLPASREVDDDRAREVREALAHLLASENFSRAQRMSRLITFLIESELRGDTERLSEYGLGIEVFDRDVRAYSTCDDPIVRVQMGRLRERLAAYYAHSGAAAAYRFSVPLGSYRPIIARGATRGGVSDDALLLSIVPLVSCNPERRARTFTQGLNEELAYRLFRAFPQRIIPDHFAQSQAAEGKTSRITHVLEGSVRVSDGAVRVFLRVIDVGAGCVRWCEQFDREGTAGMLGQEELAHAACCALQHFFGPMNASGGA